LSERRHLIKNLLRAFGEDRSALWGAPDRQAAVWAAHNPYDLASKLRGLDLFVYVGNAEPGPLDRPTTTAEGRQLERALLPEGVAFVERLHRLRTPSTSTPTVAVCTPGRTGDGSSGARCAAARRSAAPETRRAPPTAAEPSLQRHAVATGGHGRAIRGPRRDTR
jgi:hypothetical protein